MKRLFILCGVLVALGLPAIAVDDVVAARKALMSSVGAAAGVSAGVMRGEIDYAPAIGLAAIAAINATATVYGDFFPEGSDGDERSTAAAAVWTDRAGFEAELAKLQADAAAAREAAGREGPPDAEAFAALIQPVLGTCRSCHEGYRVQNN